ncbi:hypothetical protein ADUPG1_010004, partial [Aduncisulcus paluster]
MSVDEIFLSETVLERISKSKHVPLTNTSSIIQYFHALFEQRASSLYRVWELLLQRWVTFTAGQRLQSRACVPFVSRLDEVRLELGNCIERVIRIEKLANKVGIQLKGVLQELMASSATIYPPELTCDDCSAALRATSFAMPPPSFSRTMSYIHYISENNGLEISYKAKLISSRAREVSNKIPMMPSNHEHVIIELEKLGREFDIGVSPRTNLKDYMGSSKKLFASLSNALLQRRSIRRKRLLKHPFARDIVKDVTSESDSSSSSSLQAQLMEESKGAQASSRMTESQLEDPHKSSLLSYLLVHDESTHLHPFSNYSSHTHMQSTASFTSKSSSSFLNSVAPLPPPPLSSSFSLEETCDMMRSCGVSVLDVGVKMG